MKIKGYFELRKRTLNFATQFLKNYSRGVIETIVESRQLENEFMTMKRFSIYFRDFIEKYDKRNAFIYLNEEAKFEEVMQINYFENLRLFENVIRSVVI